jgi:ubiquitin C-terminal hydrolase
MTALTANFLLNEPFKNRHHLNSSSSSSTINGKRENKIHKLEFVEAGVLKPPELPSNVVKLIPGKKYIAAAVADEKSPNYTNGFKHIFNKSNGSPYPDSNSPEEAEPASSGSSTYPSEGNTPESITKSLTNVPSPKLLQSSLIGGLEMEAEDDDVDDNANGTLKPSPLAVTPKRVSLKPVSPIAPPPSRRSPSPAASSPVKIIGPQLPPGYILPSSSGTSTPVPPSTPLTQASQKSLKRKRNISERCDNEVNGDAKYPVVDKGINSLSTWEGCQFKGKGALCGIKNPHNNCFLNSVLQGVCHIPQFGRFIVEKHQKNNDRCLGNWCLLCSLKGHFYNALNHPVVDANWINRYLDDIFPNHIRGSQEDAHEMLLFLLDAIDRQQQRIRRSQPGKHSSIVEQIFDGKVRSEYTCLSCHKKSICYEPIRGLSIELPRNPEHPPEMSKIVKDYFNDEKIQGYDCKNCKKKTVANKGTKIVTAPRVLIIQLKRFLRFTKISTPVIPTININLSNVMHDSQNVPYRLLGYIRHLGGTMSSGHYTATMCGFDGKTVYNFDDDSRHPVHFPMKPIQPYILFYSCNKQNSSNNLASKSPIPTPPAKRPNFNGSSSGNNLSSKSPMSTSAKKPSFNGSNISQKNSSFTVNKKNNDNGPAKRVPNDYLSMLKR